MKNKNSLIMRADWEEAIESVGKEDYSQMQKGLEELKQSTLKCLDISISNVNEKI